MTKSIAKTVLTESIELIRDTGKEAVKQVQEAVKEVVNTAGVHTAESPASNKQDLSKLAINDEAFKEAEIAKAKQVLFRERQSAEYESFVKSQQEVLKRNQQAQAEREKQAQTVKIPSLNPLRAISSKPKPGALFTTSTERIKKTQ